MNIYTEAARELSTYFCVTRQVGHTTAMMGGAFESDALVLVDNQAMRNHILREWNMLKVPSEVDVMTIGEVANGSLRGNRRPIVVDNAALYMMLDDLIHQINTLEAKNAKLELKINRALADLS